MSLFLVIMYKAVRCRWKCASTSWVTYVSYEVRESVLIIDMTASFQMSNEWHDRNFQDLPQTTDAMTPSKVMILFVARSCPFCDRLRINRPFTAKRSTPVFTSPSYQTFADHDDVLLFPVRLVVHKLYEGKRDTIGGSRKFERGCSAVNKKAWFLHAH